MKTVVYTDEFEPITVIELSASQERHLLAGRRLPYRKIEPLPLYVPEAGAEPTIAFTDYELRAERFVFCGARRMVVFSSREGALALPPQLLPGQQLYRDQSKGRWPR